MATLFSRRFGWACAGVLAAVGITPQANPTLSETLSNQTVQDNSIPERLRIARERLATEAPKNIDRDKQAPRFTQWYNGR
jgi:hypothetical protein